MAHRKEVRQLLGEKLMTADRRYHFLTDKARVELGFSHIVASGEGDDAHLLFGLYLTPR